MIRKNHSVQRLSTLGLLALVLPAANAAAQYPYNYGFTQGQYPYYSSPYFHRVQVNGTWAYVPYPAYNSYYYPLGHPASQALSGMMPPTPAPAQPTTPAANVATLDVTVPDPNAEVWIGGVKTAQTGTQRRFISPPLNPGPHSYQIKVVYRRNGKTVEESQKVTFAAGEHRQVLFLQ